MPPAGREHVGDWKLPVSMHDFNRMEQLPHLSNIQKFLIFFHMPEKRARQGKTGRAFAWTWHLRKPKVVLKWENP